MSGKFMGMIWDLDIPHPQAWVLMAYADHADHNGEHIYPGIQLIAYKTGYSRRQAQEITRQLVADGLLVVTLTGGGRGKATEYRLDFSAASLKASDTITNSAETAPFTEDDGKGAETARFTSETAQSEAKTAQKPRTNHAETVQFSALKGAVATAPQGVNPLTPLTPGTNQPPTGGAGGEESEDDADCAEPETGDVPGPQRIVRLLTDPDVGMSAVQAQTISQRQTFETVLAHVMSWRREGQKQELGVGALAWRLEHGRKPPKPSGADLRDDLYVRHCHAGDPRAAEAAYLSNRYATN